MTDTPTPLPVADPETGLTILKALARKRSLLTALEIMHQEVGDVFQITLPVFRPAVVVGPEWNRCILVSDREKFDWRVASDPVAQLLRHGLLVEDGESHDHLRALMEPSLRRSQVNQHDHLMIRHTDGVTALWEDGGTVDMVVEMRRVALLILFESLFGVDFQPHMERLWDPILRAIDYISPGLWVVAPWLPRGRYQLPLKQLDAYLFDIIAQHRAKEVTDGKWLGDLIAAGLSDDLIRDQMLTMLIAGHDTSTALLSWTFYLLGRHPQEMATLQSELDEILGSETPNAELVTQLPLLDQVIKESLRLYPPIHIGNRRTNCPVHQDGTTIPAGTRTMYSIYLSHRDQALWENAEDFEPERFDRSERPKQQPFAYLPFGGGPRNCIGAAFAQVEAKLILARVLQQFDLELLDEEISVHMGATLEPRPGVRMRVTRRHIENG